MSGGASRGQEGWGGAYLPWLRRRGFSPIYHQLVQKCNHQRPYHPGSHPNSEVKQDRVQVVLRWGTTREGWMLLVFLLIFSSFLLLIFSSFLLGNALDFCFSFCGVLLLFTLCCSSVAGLSLQAILRWWRPRREVGYQLWLDPFC